MQQATKVYLSDYKPFPFLLESVDIRFVLDQTATRVITRIAFKPNPEYSDRRLVLDGMQLKLISAKINGVTVPESKLHLTENGLEIDAPTSPFIWECETEINPSENTSLEGLYISNGLYCTQCEAEGFRKITYYPDRPDVMTTFKIRIESDQPVMLSNGNPTASGEGWAEWHDPWPKPSYLFALVAGALVSVDDSFTTNSGRKVDLKIYVRSGDEGKCAYAMDSLIRSMAWDEQVYGREYDLDLFNIVAVDDFNMGAMENKGLNIFNSALVLASPETATDKNFGNIESVIAHEYFHNWTGNRITCRDWFQLCLKEGLTVYRDQQFTGDMRDKTVQRIADAQLLRTRQFREDTGPLAHPPRPSEYIEIDNFYTATVYEKGAEIVGMLHLLVGDAAYRKSLDLYFDRHDGQACTIDDWITVFQDITGRDLSQFKLWYTSAGTPTITAVETWEHGVFNLTLTQSTPATPDESDKAPRHIPVAIGLLNPDGHEAVATKILELTEQSQTFSFTGLEHRPIASILRGFSAPVKLVHDSNNAFLLAHDTDPFNKWEAGHKTALGILCDLATGGKNINAGFLTAMHNLAKNQTLAPAFRALALTLPSEETISAAVFENGHLPDPVQIFAARKSLTLALATEMAETLPTMYQDLKVKGAYSPNADASGLRALRNNVLVLLTALDPDAKHAKTQFVEADNMTDQMAALTFLVAADRAKDALQKFYTNWQHEKLVLDKWFAVQAASSPPQDAVNRVKRLSEHPDFDWKNPNRFRSLLGMFAGGNLAGFHNPNGKGYGLLADWIIKLDPVNPKSAAVMSTAFESWRRFAPARQAQIKTELNRILDTKGLSKNCSEIVSRIIS